MRVRLSICVKLVVNQPSSAEKNEATDLKLDRNIAIYCAQADIENGSNRPKDKLTVPLKLRALLLFKKIINNKKLFFCSLLVNYRRKQINLQKFEYLCRNEIN